MPLSRAAARVKPPALRPGDVVGIVAPASNIRRSDLEAGCEALRRAGYRPFYFNSILEQDLYFAGSTARRKRELEDMFERDDVRAIICARGGYGTNYLLEALDLQKIKDHPKIFVGYSDLTTLLTHFVDKSALVTFHGPMVAKDWAHEGGVDSPSWQAALSRAEGWELSRSDYSGVGGLVDGDGEGILYGGCLSLLVASLGTRYEIRTEGTILFMEDIATKPYQVDRMLMQLKLAGKFEGVRGIIFGEMVACVQTAKQEYTLEGVVHRIVGGLGIPVAYGLPSGHVTARNITLPFGVRAELSVRGREVKLNILEAAVTGD
jgi:muramoyltetrapeptide carboxypeptidase